MNFNAKKEQEKLTRIINNIPGDKKELVEGLIADASFMVEELEKLRKHISKNGWSEPYQNGANQHGRKPTVESDMYIKLQKSYVSTIRQLQNAMATTSTEQKMAAGEGFAELVKKGRKYEVS